MISHLAEFCQVTVVRFAALAPADACASLLSGIFSPGRDARSPDLIIGAGHGTHLSMLAARRCRGGKVVCLMRPSLPIGCFDLCLIPRHDQTRPHRKVMTTFGVLNSVRPTRHHDPALGLILLGGRSRHFAWKNRHITNQVVELTRRCQDRQWLICDSRRTPSGMVADLSAHLDSGNATLVSWRDTPAAWLTDQMSVAGSIWTTPDSASMLYEALTSGASVGVLDMPTRRRGRVSAGVSELIRERAVTPFTEWRRSGSMHENRLALDEAHRCAAHLVRELLGEPVQIPGTAAPPVPG